jgi:integrase
MLSLAIKWGWRSDNPARGIERYPEAKRTRYLTPNEFERLTKALAKYPDTVRRPDFARQVANIIRLLLLTGARSGEVQKAEWSQFELESGEWVKPGSTTKQKTEHRVPLSAPALSLLKDILADAEKGTDGKPASRYVFPGRNPDMPIPEFRDEWYAIRKLADLNDVRVHDLRHSFASVMASKGASLPMIGALLGHSNPITTARYAHLFSDPLRTLVDEVGHVVTGTKKADVTPIRKDGAA